MVFMQHGLMVAMWMGMTALIGFWLWRSKTIRQISDIPMYVLVPAIFFTVYLCKSKYAVLLLFMGIASLYLAKWLRTKWVIVALLCVPLGYMVARSQQIISSESLIGVAEHVFGEERAASLGTHLKTEDALSARAMERPWFGWGGWGGYRVADENGKDLVTDSLWIITLGKSGWVGVIGLMTMLLLPLLLVAFDWRVELWLHPLVAPVVVLAMVVAMYMFDHLMNGMVNPIFMLAAGAVNAAHYAVPRVAARAMPQQMRRPAPFTPVAPQSFRPA
jgi:hypothetical protein